jgi:hypothetical protein
VHRVGSQVPFRVPASVTFSPLSLFTAVVLALETATVVSGFIGFPGRGAGAGFVVAEPPHDPLPPVGGAPPFVQPEEPPAGQRTSLVVQKMQTQSTWQRLISAAVSANGNNTSIAIVTASKACRGTSCTTAGLRSSSDECPSRIPHSTRCCSALSVDLPSLPEGCRAVNTPLLPRMRPRSAQPTNRTTGAFKVELSYANSRGGGFSGNAKTIALTTLGVPAASR